MKSIHKIFWGIIFVLGAIFLLVSQMGLIPELKIGFWSILGTIVSVYILVEGIIKFQFSGIFFGIALLGIIYDEFLGIEAITPWPILGAAALLTIGCHILFPRRKYKKAVAVTYNDQDGNTVETDREKRTDAEEHYDSESGENLSFTQVFQSSTKYVTSDNLCYVSMECAFSNMNVYLNNAVLVNGRATLDIDNVFGTTNLYVPASWVVTDNADNVFASLNYRGNACPDGQNRLDIKADNVFGNINVFYI